MAKMTENEYVDIKEMCDHGMTTASICKHSPRGHATIARVRRSKDFDDYKAITRKDGENYLRYRQEEETAVEPHTEKKRFYDEFSDKEKIICHYNSIMEHLIGIGKVLNDWMNKQDG